MNTWTKDELHRIAVADDLHISPFRMTGRRTALLHGSGLLSSMTRSTFARTAVRALVGTRLPCVKRRGGSPWPA